MSVKIDGSGIITGLDADGISAQPVFPGQVLQVVSAVYSTETTTSFTTFTSTGLSASITPSSASNKILVIHSGTGGSNGTVVNNSNEFTIFRGTTSGTNLGSSEGLLTTYTDAVSTFRVFGNLSMIVLDSPSTTSPQTYTVAMKSITGQTAVAQKFNIPSTLILMEIAG